ATHDELLHQRDLLRTIVFLERALPDDLHVEFGAGTACAGFDGFPEGMGGALGDHRNFVGRGRDRQSQRGQGQKPAEVTHGDGSNAPHFRGVRNSGGRPRSRTVRTPRLNHLAGGAVDAGASAAVFQLKAIDSTRKRNVSPMTTLPDVVADHLNCTVNVTNSTAAASATSA